MAYLTNVKSYYSLRQSTLSIDDIIEHAQKGNYEGTVLCDKNMLGVKEFYDKCIKSNIKPIVGLELDMKFGNMGKYPVDLVAMNNEGYKELIKLSTRNELSNEDIEFNEIKDSANLMKIFSQNSILEKNDYNNRQQFYQELNRYLDNSNYMYIGVYDGMNENMINEYTENNAISFQLGVCEFNPKRALDIEGIKTIKMITDIENEDIILNDNQTINNVIHNHNEETTKIFNDIEFNIDQEDVLPRFDDHTEAESYNILVDEVKKGLLKKYSREEIANKTCVERAIKELEVIKNMGFSNYFLVVRDYVKWAKDNHIRVAPGRGSAAGSIVSYALDITDIDPLKYGLLFERFLNKDRISMPDIDVDFDSKRRGEVIKYISDRYGSDKVAQIVTFNTYGCKNSIKELAKSIGLTRGEYDELAKHVPSTSEAGDDFSLVNLYQISPTFRASVDKYPGVKDILLPATILGRMPKSLGTHAGGVVISSKPLQETVPLIKTGGDTKNVQYSKDYIESIGLLKMDILATDTLTKIDEIEQMIRKNHPQDNFHIDKCPLDDKKTFDMISKGDTIGVFQLESPLAKNTLRQMKCESFDDIIAAISLGRPGPIENLPEYCNRKNGKSEIKYTIPELEPILKDTYGILIYQEQVMRCATDLASMSLSQADTLRKAMSKKDAHIIENMKGEFIEGCLKNGITKENAIKVYKDMEKFAEYGFNKSHAVAYAMLSYQLAYAKANYPKEYYCSLLNYTSKLAEIQNECKKNDIKLMTPSVNEAKEVCTTKDNNIMFALKSIKGVGPSAADSIVKEREANGKFTSIVDFIERVNPAKNTYQALVDSGALDCFGYNRTTIKNNYDNIKTFLDGKDLFMTDTNDFTLQAYKDNYSQISKLEKNALGIYVSSSPVSIAKKLDGDNRIADINKLGNRKYATVIGEILNVREHLDKNGNYMANLVIGDESGNVKATVFANKYYDAQSSLVKGNIVKINGAYKVSERYGNSINVNAIETMDISKMQQEVQQDSKEVETDKEKEM